MRWLKMDKKKEVILSVFFLLNAVNGRTFLQKFFYLLNREIFAERLFNYKPYKYGPFSQDINIEISELEKDDLIEENRVLIKGKGIAYSYALTSKGRDTAKKIFNDNLSPDERTSLIDYTNQFREFSPTQLLKYVYEKYPEVTENSVFEG